MKLISCSIENFGKLHNFKCDFNDSCNVICEKNGWGKSTLAAFLCTMFYGFLGEGKQDEITNERKKYYPWQQGVYGGSLTFEANGVAYTVTRIFDKTKAKGKNTFVLKYVDTNLECNDFTENLGVELFGMDRDSFEKTIHITQNDCEIKMTDGISARLSEFPASQDDINNYENAIRTLDKEIIEKLRPDKKKGKLEILSNKIHSLEFELSKKEQLKKAKEKDEFEIKKIEQNIKSVSEKIDKEKKQLINQSDEYKHGFGRKLLFFLVSIMSVLGVLAGKSIGLNIEPLIVGAGVIILLAFIFCFLGNKNKRTSNNSCDTLDLLLEEKENLKEEMFFIKAEIKSKEKLLFEMKEKENQLKELRENYSRLYTKYELIKKTSAYLSKARDNITAKYSGPVINGFRKYFSIISDDDYSDYYIDARGNMSVKEYGIMHDIRHLSDGNRAMLGICYKMALVDAMYTREKPFLILDDPFVNFDDDKLKKCSAFIHELSREYQIIYFTCNNSRKI